MRQHFAEQHPNRGDGSQRRAPRASGPQSVGTGRDDASSHGRCLYCGRLVSREHLAEHVREEHPDVAPPPDDDAGSEMPQQSKVAMEPCRECGAKIRPDRMNKHLAKVHGLGPDGTKLAAEQNAEPAPPVDQDPWPSGLSMNIPSKAEAEKRTAPPQPRFVFRVDGDVLLIRETRRGRGRGRRTRTVAVIPRDQWPELKELLAQAPPEPPVSTEPEKGEAPPEQPTPPKAEEAVAEEPAPLQTEEAVAEEPVPAQTEEKVAEEPTPPQTEEAVVEKPAPPQTVEAAAENTLSDSLEPTQPETVVESSESELPAQES